MIDNLTTKIDLIDERLQAFVACPEVPYRELFEAARYSLFSGGKRLRPLLTLLSTEALRGNIEAALAPACAIEMIHTYSLIHDDLPSMDDDDLRRGKPTLHKVYPEGHAILTGDYLLTYAFQILASAPLLTDTQRVALVRTLSQAAGATGMIGGQVMDIQNKGKSLSESVLKMIHQCKTGALISAAVQCGAIVAHATPTQIDILGQFGLLVGEAFQIVDDLLDNDSQAACESPRQKAQKLLDSALRLLHSLPGPTEELAQLAHSMVDRER